MKPYIFEDCLKHWKSSSGNQPFWTQLARKHGYPSGEALRSAFKRERLKLGVDKINHEVFEPNQRSLTVGVVDVEILPMIGMMWKLYDVDFYPEQVIQDTTFLSWAGKYLHSDVIYSDILTPDEAIDRDPRRISESLYAFISKCDIAIGHNIKYYDSRVINTVFLEYQQPVRYRAIDTLEVAKTNFKFASNKLAFINKKLGIRDKISNEGFMLWRKCSEGDPESLRIMEDYNRGDILSTEELFYKFQPYITNIPNFSIYSDSHVPSCACGCSDLTQEGYFYTNTAKYDKLRCGNCHALIRGKKNLLSKEKKESLLVRL